MCETVCREEKEGKISMTIGKCGDRKRYEAGIVKGRSRGVDKEVF